MKAGALLRTLKEGALETLYPTRCAICDAHGQLICEKCRSELQLIDHEKACPYCGAPFGREQCTECDGDGEGGCEGKCESRFPFEACRAIGTFDDAFASLIRVYKDLGERRLCSVIAEMMAIGAGADWRGWAQAVTFVPATEGAYRRRGFDHMELVAREFSRMTHIPLADVMIKRETQDQRGLDAAGRKENVERSLVVSGREMRPHKGERMLLLDDVFTTGSTLSAAASALRAAGCGAVRALVFARVA